MNLIGPKLKITGVILFITLAFQVEQVSAQKLKKQFRDTIDNAIDVSNFLNSVTGFLAVPSVITEPALGYGGGLALIYFHKNKKNYGEGKYGPLPPVLSFAGGGGTSNKTYFGVLGHVGSYKKDRFRYVGVLGMANINLSFFGAGIIHDEVEYKFNMKGWFIFQEFSTRINRDVPFFVGANYVYFNNTIKFNRDIENPILDDLEKATSTAGINSIFTWDSRDNTFTPNRGIIAVLEAGIYNKALGGDNNFNNINFRTYAYTDKILPKTVAGFRLATQGKWGNPSFYELPFIMLRGIPVMRYQDNIVSVVETEWRYNIWRRWSLVGFTGAGFAYPEFKAFSFDRAKINYGGGFRYYLARQYRMHAGIDIARGPEEWAWYIVVGSSWLR